MLYPLSYEGLACTFAQHAGRVLIRWTRVGCLTPDGLCRTCAVCRGPAFTTAPNTRCRLWRPIRLGVERVLGFAFWAGLLALLGGWCCCRLGSRAARAAQELQAAVREKWRRGGGAFAARSGSDAGALAVVGSSG
jgi:hypothetical protein